MKTEILGGVVRGKTVIVDVNTGKAYSDENKFLMPMLERMEFRARYFIGDAYYGKSVEVLIIVAQAFGVYNPFQLIVFQ